MLLVVKVKHHETQTLTLARETLGRDEAVQCSSARWPNKDRWMEMPAFCNFKIQEIEVCLFEQCMFFLRREIGRRINRAAKWISVCRIVTFSVNYAKRKMMNEEKTAHC
jgi:hypothetical protein